MVEERPRLRCEKPSCARVSRGGGRETTWRLGTPLVDVFARGTRPAMYHAPRRKIADAAMSRDRSAHNEPQQESTVSFSSVALDVLALELR